MYSKWDFGKNTIFLLKFRVRSECLLGAMANYYMKMMNDRSEGHIISFETVASRIRGRRTVVLKVNKPLLTWCPQCQQTASFLSHNQARGKEVFANWSPHSQELTVLAAAPTPCRPWWVCLLKMYSTGPKWGRGKTWTMIIRSPLEGPPCARRCDRLEQLSHLGRTIRSLGECTSPNKLE